MKCEAYADAIAEYVEGTLVVDRQRELERHLEGCEACRTLVADLRAIRTAAFTLDRLAPPAHVWPRIEAATRAAGTPDDDPSKMPAVGLAGIFGRRSIGTARPGPWSIRWAAAAAVLMLATAVGVYSVWTRSSTVPAGPAARSDAPSGALVASVEADLQAAEAHYEKAIQGLEQIARSDDESLDPAVAEVLKKNLQVIDRAIDESRAAVNAEPTSTSAQESLFDAMRSKVALLQQTVELVNEMRKGNQAEAGRIMQGLGKP